jgi:hypothetical protein
MGSGVCAWDVFFSRMRAPIISNLVLFLILVSLGQAPLYLFWVAAYFST